MPIIMTLGRRRITEKLVMVLYALSLNFLCFAYANEPSGSFRTRSPIPSLRTKPCVQNFREKSAICHRRGLKQIPNDLINDLMFLNLSQNMIEALKNTSFSGYSLLAKLDLSQNDVGSIDIMALKPLAHLRELGLAGNKNLQTLEADVFRWSHNLTKLDLSGCGLTHFPNEIMNFLPRLDSLFLDHNRLSHVNVSHCHTDGIRLSITLNGNDFHFLTKETFQLTCNCSTLDLTDNPFEYVDPEAIASLRCKRLIIGTDIDLTPSNYSAQVYHDLFTGIAQSPTRSVVLKFGNAGDAFETSKNFFDPMRGKNFSELVITGYPLVLDAYIFWNISVSQLSITGSDLLYVHAPFFEGLFKLKVLDLHDSNLFFFDPLRSTMWNLPIEEINLSQNNLFTLFCNAFRGLHKLSKLDLSDNPRLWYLCALEDYGYRNLRYLDLSGTAIDGYGVSQMAFQMPNLRSFSYSWRLLDIREPKGPSFFTTGTSKGPSTFVNATALESIVVENSYLTLKELWDLSANVSIFLGLEYLQLLDLSSNDIGSLPRGLFPQLPLLRELDLSQCDIRVIDAGVFSNLGALKVLHLDNNHLIELPLDLFQANNGHLSILYLHSNFLNDIEETLFIHTPELTNITLADNQLTTLLQNTFTPIRSTLKSIDLSANPLECSCELQWLIRLKKSPVDLLRSNQTICSATSDTAFRWKPLFSIDPSDLCMSHIVVICTIPLIFAGCLVCLSVVCYMSRFVKYKKFLLKLAIFGFNVKIDPRDRDDFKFDLNVIFTEQDEAWAKEQLMPNLGRHLPHFDRITLGDNDLPYGMYYFDAVYDIIESSFKTILLFSRAAVKDQHFMMKLRFAFDHVTTTQTQSTMMIILDDVLDNIPDNEMPDLVKLYFSEERPYLYWEENNEDQIYFWKQLTKKLIFNVKCDDRIPTE